LEFDLKVEVTGKSQRAPLFPLIFQLCERRSQEGGPLHTLSEAIIIVKAITKIPKRPLFAQLVPVLSEQPRINTHPLSLRLPLADKEVCNDDNNDDDMSECDGAEADVEEEGGEVEDIHPVPLFGPLHTAAFTKDHLRKYIHSHTSSLAARRRRRNCGETRSAGTKSLRLAANRVHPYSTAAAAFLLPPHTKKKVEPMDHLTFLSTLAALLPRTTSTLPPQEDSIVPPY